MRPTDQIYSRQEATKYLKSMPAGMQVALLRMGNELSILQGFTSNPELLIAAMNEKKNTLLPAGTFMDRNLLTP